MHVEHSFLLLHVRPVIVESSIAFVGITTGLTCGVVGKQACVLTGALDTITTAITQSIPFFHRSDRSHRLLELRVAKATEYGQCKEGQAKDEQQTEESPLELVGKDERSKHFIDLILGPARLTLDIGQREEVTICLRDRILRVITLEQIVAEKLHVEEDALQGSEAHA